jgi:hypothetical protein
LSGFATTGISPLSEDDFLSSYVSDRPEPTVAQKESSTSELYAASQSLFNKSAPSSSRKNEAAVSSDIIQPLLRPSLGNQHLKAERKESPES